MEPAAHSSASVARIAAIARPARFRYPPGMSDAMNRFRDSMKIGYDEWHDGVGYDLDAFAELTDDQKRDIAREMRAKSDPDWRDMEVLRVEGSRESFDRLRDFLTGGPASRRAWALRELYATGKMGDAVFDRKLAQLLNDVEIGEGMTEALMLAQAHAGDETKASLLRNTRDRLSVAFHFATTLMVLAGVLQHEMDFAHREVRFRLQATADAADRQNAFVELCALLKVDGQSIG